MCVACLLGVIWSSVNLAAHRRQAGRQQSLGQFQLLSPMRSMQGQQDTEVGTARPALAFDQALVLLHEGLSECEPEAATAVPTRHQRVEDAFANILGDARTVINDMQV